MLIIQYVNVVNRGRTQRLPLWVYHFLCSRSVTIKFSLFVVHTGTEAHPDRGPVVFVLTSYSNLFRQHDGAVVTTVAAQHKGSVSNWAAQITPKTTVSFQSPKITTNSETALVVSMIVVLHLLYWCVKTVIDRDKAEKYIQGTILSKLSS